MSCRSDLPQPVGRVAVRSVSLVVLQAVMASTSFGGQARAFDFSQVAQRAARLAAQPYRDEASTLPKELRDLSYDDCSSIRFRPEKSLWHGARLAFELSFLHEGMSFDLPVRINEASSAGIRRIRFDPADFDYGRLRLDPHELRRLGGMDRPEEFPVFLGFWFERPAPNSPSLWVEPRAGWSRGSVHLVELPAEGETQDSIVAFWSPQEAPQPGQELLYAHRLYWGSVMPMQPPLARVAATRTGIGGVVGRRRDHVSWRFVVDFAGGELAHLGERAKAEPVITASRGRIELTSARPIQAIHGYRAMFDLRPGDESAAPYDLRLYLRSGARALSETWIYQWSPPDGRQPERCAG